MEPSQGVGMGSSRQVAIVVLVAAGAALVGLACAAGTTEPRGPENEPIDAVGQGSADAGEAPTEGESTVPDPYESEGQGGQGRLRVKVLASGESAPANVKVFTDADRPVVAAEGPASQSFELPAGSYDVEVTLESALDRPQKRLDNVAVRAGDTTDREAAFTVGQITLQPMRGRTKVGTTVRWRYMGGGDWFTETSNCGQEITLSAGRYDAEVTIGRINITISDIQVYEGRRTVSPPVQMR